MAINRIRTKKIRVLPGFTLTLGFTLFYLGLIVLIRTFLSFSLEIEIEGIVPWRRWRLMAPGSPPPEGRDDTG